MANAREIVRNAHHPYCVFMASGKNGAQNVNLTRSSKTRLTSPGGQDVSTGPGKTHVENEITCYQTTGEYEVGRAA